MSVPLLHFLKKKNTTEKPNDPGHDPVEKPDTKIVLDEIVAAVYAHLKPLGFRKHGRTLHRFVSGDISQVVSFQVYRNMMEPSDKFCVNLGIRVPECAERKFQPSIEKTNYQEQGMRYYSSRGTVYAAQSGYYTVFDDDVTRMQLKNLDALAVELGFREPPTE